MPVANAAGRTRWMSDRSRLWIGLVTYCMVLALFEYRLKYFVWPSSVTVYRLIPVSLLPAANEQSPVRWILGEAGCSLVFLALTLLVGMVSGRSFRELGLRPVSPRLIGRGFLVGFGLVTIFMAAILLCGGLHVAGRGEGVAKAAGFGLLWLMAHALVGFFEELSNRAAPLLLLVDLAGPWAACSLTALAFAAEHIRNAGEDPVGLALGVVWGLAAAGTVLRTGTIWYAAGLHAGWDWTLGYLYGARVSGLGLQGGFLSSDGAGPPLLNGGSAGPEGSLLTMAVTVGWAAAVFLLPWPRRASAASPA